MDESLPKAGSFILIDSAQDLVEKVSGSKAARHEWVAVDAERASGFRYYQRAYLIQFHFESDQTWLVDPLIFDEDRLGKIALEALIALLPERWILHASTQDFPCLFELGLRPREVFDTEVAAKLLGLPKVGLASLLLEMQGIELAKEHSAADWSIRPLTKSMLGYAALDVQHLHALKQTLETKLREVNRFEWAVQEFQHLLKFIPKPFDELKWLKLPGVQQERDLVVSKIAKSLWMTRETLAEGLDISPGRILPDRSIAAAAISKPATKHELISNPEFSGRMARSKLDLWWRAIQSSEDLEVETRTKEGRIPNHRSWDRRFPEAHARYGTLRPLILSTAEDLSMMPEVLVSPDAIRAIAFEDVSSEERILEILNDYGVRLWQKELVLPVLIGWLGGSRANGG